MWCVLSESSGGEGADVDIAEINKGVFKMSDEDVLLVFWFYTA